MTAAEAPPPPAQFRPFAALAPDERRLLEASRAAVSPAAECGEELYTRLATERPRWLANFLNQAAVLETVVLPDGGWAIARIVRVERFCDDRIFAEVDPALFTGISALAGRWGQPGKPYSGPENSSMLHGQFGVCFRENRPWTSQQIAFDVASGYRHVDIDIDEEGPASGHLGALLLHLGRVGTTLALPGDPFKLETDPYDIYRRLSRPETRGLAPHYVLDANR